MIEHVKCNVFDSGADAILHQVNCHGVMGSGVAKQVRLKYPRVYSTYKKACAAKENSKKDLLGLAQVVSIGDGKSIVNLFAQENFGYDGTCYTDYDALRTCLTSVKSNFSGRFIALPHLMGCHRGGGDWEKVHQMIEEIFDDDCGTRVMICEYDGG